ncbi:hypothetical protein DTO217A2_1575 [Paecilomyces variotii]|nr:hypothetical protein DTO217A2_1575 [Paecilomyces variotii]
MHYHNHWFDNELNYAQAASTLPSAMRFSVASYYSEVTSIPSFCQTFSHCRHAKEKNWANRPNRYHFHNPKPTPTRIRAEIQIWRPL